MKWPVSSRTLILRSGGLGEEGVRGFWVGEVKPGVGVGGVQAGISFSFCFCFAGDGAGDGGGDGAGMGFPVVGRRM